MGRPVAWFAVLALVLVLVFGGEIGRGRGLDMGWGFGWMFVFELRQVRVRVWKLRWWVAPCSCLRPKCNGHKGSRWYVVKERRK